MRLSRAMLVAALVFGAACEAPTDTLAPDVDAQFARSADKFDPACKPKKLKADQKGKVSRNDCLYTLGGRDQREDLYVLESAGGNQMMTFTTNAEFDGLLGITEDGKPLFEGVVLGSRTFQAGTPRVFHFVGGSPTYGMFFSGYDETQFGKYTITTEVAPVSYQCGGGVFFMEGTVGFDQYLDGGNACEYTIQFSPFPDVIGKPIWTQGFNAKLTAGESYTVRLEGLDASFQPALTVFTYGPFTPIAQDLSSSSSDGDREVTFSVPNTRYVYIEISSGTFDGNGDWVLQDGTYGFSFFQN